MAVRLHDQPLHLTLNAVALRAAREPLLHHRNVPSETPKHGRGQCIVIPLWMPFSAIYHCNATACIIANETGRRRTGACCFKDAM